MASAPRKLSDEVERIREGSRLRLRQVPRGEYEWERPPFVVQELADTLAQAERWSRYLKTKGGSQAGRRGKSTGLELDGESCRQARGFVYQAQRVLVMCDGIVEAWKPGVRKDHSMQAVYVYSVFVSFGLLLGSWVMGRYAPVSG